MSLIEALVIHQLEISGASLCLILIGAYLDFPFFKKFIILDGEQANGTYVKSFSDIHFVLFCFTVVMFARTFLMEFIFVPLIKSRGAKNQIKVRKFKEQSFLIVYYSFSFSVGCYLLYNSPYWFNTSQLWIGYPHLELPPGIKMFYLFQLGYWLQQVAYVQFEVRRKDHFNMVAHHIITNLLLVLSYYCNFTRIGHVILTLMDFADIFLSLVKVLIYLKFNAVCDVIFVFFVLSWFFTRHVGYLVLICSIFVDPMKYNIAKWDPANGFFITESTRVVFLVLLLALQVLLILWFKIILTILYRTIRGENVKDDRSSGDENPEGEKKEK